MRALERDGDMTGRLALLEELKGLPFGAAWDYDCLTQGVPVGIGFMDEVRAREDRAGEAGIASGNIEKAQRVHVVAHARSLRSDLPGTSQAARSVRGWRP
jgi:hypothetical protein